MPIRKAGASTKPRSFNNRWSRKSAIVLIKLLLPPRKPPAYSTVTSFNIPDLGLIGGIRLSRLHRSRKLLTVVDGLIPDIVSDVSFSPL